jgi:hypothetical protein
MRDLKKKDVMVFFLDQPELNSGASTVDIVYEACKVLNREGTPVGRPKQEPR